MQPIDLLLSLPPAATRAIAKESVSNIGFVTSDPPGSQLGSGGGTAYLLTEALRNMSAGQTLTDWLSHSRKLMIHGSGQSRRLPGYATEGKPLLPLPTSEYEVGQTPDRCLLDIQRAYYERLYWHAPDCYRLMVACGDVLVRNESFPPLYPEADVLIVGLEAPPEEARNHGVMFCKAGDNQEMEFFLQKPDVHQINQLARSFSYYLDTGIWLFSQRAIDVLMSRCGWLKSNQAYRNPLPEPYDLYDSFGLSLGHTPKEHDPEISPLTCAVLPLPNGRFYHFGTNRSILASASQLLAPQEKRRSFGHGSLDAQAKPIVLHADVTCDLTEGHRHIWIENSSVGDGWRLHNNHVLTGIPENDWTIDLPSGVCVDILQIEGGAFCLRTYGFQDPFRGQIGNDTTQFLGTPLKGWLEQRTCSLDALGDDRTLDIQQAPLFPVSTDIDTLGRLLLWMVTDSDDATCAALWQQGERLSAAELGIRADIAGRRRSRSARMSKGLESLTAEGWREACKKLDLEAIAQRIDKQALDEPPALPHQEHPSLEAVHDAMFRTRVKGADNRATTALSELIVGQMAVEPVSPTRHILPDQIIWGRSPARLDLAGGWTDTPPYCLEHGGRVVNIGVNLNGQPPIQVFARATNTPQITLRSIDLGIDETIKTYEELVQSPRLGGGFSIARAALRLAGLDPRFNAQSGSGTLQAQLARDFGGGIELSMLAAIPKGSGLGTSSILASTLLGTLNEVFGLGWNTVDLFSRTLALEQMLTSGGGWQDQAGGLLPGLKAIETAPGIRQYPMVHWLPDQQIRDGANTQRVLLYYTGITRVAHNILGEIVKGIFLNDSNRIAVLSDIAANAEFASDVIQTQNWNGLCTCIRRSWELNQRLDSGTNPPAVQQILQRIAPWMAAGKLLGAGGGGYLLILANDEQDGANIREELMTNPPSPGARFVDVSVSTTGFQVTRS